MSRLKDLIQEYCPDGVEYVELGKVCDFITGFAFKASTFHEHGLPVCRTTNIINGYISFDNMVCITPDDYAENLDKFLVHENDIVIGMSGTIKVGINKNQQSCYLNQRVGKFLPKDPLYPEFLYYVLCSSVQLLLSRIDGGSVKNLSNKDLSLLKIPLPPLEIQKEIVKILDKFTEYDTELQSELQSELQKRLKQYEYYRDKLLAHESKLGVVNVRLGDICEKVSNVKWGQNDQYKYIDLTSVDKNTNRIVADLPIINEENAPSRAKQIVKKGDILFGKTRPTLMRLCSIPDSLDKQICSTGYCVIRPRAFKVLGRYIYHCMLTSRFLEYCESTQKGVSYPAMTDNEVKEYKIPLPPLPIQNRIVEVLDNFDKICSDLKIGLPAEIEKRQQQYEFYRDAILTFVEKGEITGQRERESLRRIIQYIFGYAPVKLNDVCKLVRGVRVVRSSLQNEGKVPVYQNSLTPLGYCNSGNCVGKTTFIIAAGAAGEVGYSKEAFWAADDCFCLKCNQEIQSKFLYYVLTSQSDKIKCQVRRASIPRISRQSIENLSISLPTQAHQKIIVNILDRFDQLCHDLRIGLPAEIERHQKRYEYYRDKLLALPEKK